MQVVFVRKFMIRLDGGKGRGSKVDITQNQFIFSQLYSTPLHFPGKLLGTPGVS